LPIFSLLAAVTLIALLAGCGQITQPGSDHPATNTTATQMPTSVPTTAVANGCPSRQAPADAGAFHPDLTVAYSLDQGAAQPVTLTHGQHLEIRLSPLNQWSLTITDPTHILASTSSEGWYDPSANACMWRFTAIGSGGAHLAFKGLVLCPPNIRCTAALDLAAFDVTAR
jgi:hypothetical protein